MESSNRIQRTTDVALGAALVVAPTAGRLARLAAVPAALTWRLVSRPPLVPEQFTLAAVAERLEARGRLARELSTDRGIDKSIEMFDLLVPALTIAVVDRLDLVDLITRVVNDETATALISQLDLESLVGQVITAPVIDAALAQVDPIALTEQHLDPKMVEKLVALVLPPVMNAALDQLDLTALVSENVDLLALSNQVVEELDLAAITNEVIDEIDLPGIIRESTSGVATDVVRGTRASAASADEAIANFFGRKRRD